ncbi:glycosyltransferase family A protein [Lactobacillus johnsonii]|uniref:glycosyltransferase family A protein n=1 Tax=Lactobacillus johnsonii TaxID=33959 RepID=UPI0017827EE7|nr:glycosyltransferase family 2 protein [Lactobacillus johnsonii]QXL46997.1 glycosyltransferase family 2 protein [Lactobacillus johnsonii]
MNNDTESLLSIIIPTYNNGKLVTKLLSALAKQKYVEKAQVIIVDDGSTDDTMEILSQEDLPSNFSVISKKHTGVSSSRNYGIKLAKGKYVTFIDADDMVSDDYIASFVEFYLSQKTYSDVVIFDVNEDTLDKYRKASAEDVCGLIEGIKNNKPFVSVGIHSKFYLKDLMIKSNIKFDPNLRVGEDLIFNASCILAAQQVILSNKKLYFYQEKHSVDKISSQNKLNELTFQRDLKEIIPNKYKEILVRYEITGICFLVERYYSHYRDMGLTFNKAASELRNILKSYEYIRDKRYDDILGRKNRILRKCLSHKLTGTSIIFINLVNGRKVNG